MNIKTTAEKIRSLYKSKEKTKNDLEELYKEFKEENPQLFDMICSNQCDDMVLTQLLYQFEEVKSGNINQHDASVNVGQVLVDKYVKPKIE